MACSGESNRSASKGVDGAPDRRLVVGVDDAGGDVGVRDTAGGSSGGSHCQSPPWVPPTSSLAPDPSASTLHRDEVPSGASNVWRSIRSPSGENLAKSTSSLGTRMLLRSPVATSRMSGPDLLPKSTATRSPAG